MLHTVDMAIGILDDDHTTPDNILDHTNYIWHFQHNETRRKLLALNPPPTLTQAVNMCRSKETASENKTSLSQRRLAHVRQEKHGQRNRGDHRSTDTSIDSCSYWGYKPHAERKICPAKDKTCNNVGN